MKLLSPCCHNQQDYNPKKKWDGKRRRTTNCKKCNTSFDINKDTIIFEENVKNNEEKTQGHDFIPPTVNHEFIDDPDELLMSVAIRELNRTNPDPRWASILINCKKENIAQKDEVIEQLQKLPTKNITEILRKQHIKSWQEE